MSNNPAVCAWVTITEDCPITFNTVTDGMATFEFGDRPDSFDVMMEPQALLRFMRIATAALEKLPALLLEDELAE